MKKQDVVVGMKVVPIRKSIGSIALSMSSEWRHARKLGQRFLYVIGWREDQKVWSLAVNPHDRMGDWFKSFEFKPYEEK